MRTLVVRLVIIAGLLLLSLSSAFGQSKDRQLISIGFLPTDIPVGVLEKPESQSPLIADIDHSLSRDFLIHWLPFSSKEQVLNALQNGRINFWLSSVEHFDSHRRYSHVIYQEPWVIAAFSDFGAKTHPLSVNALKLAAEILPEVYQHTVISAPRMMHFGQLSKGYQMLKKGEVQGLLLPYHLVYQLPSHGTALHLWPLTMWHRYMLQTIAGHRSLVWLSQIDSLLPVKMNPKWDKSSLSPVRSPVFFSKWNSVPVWGSVILVVIFGLGFVFYLCRYSRLQKQIRQYRIERSSGLPNEGELNEQLAGCFKQHRSVGVFMFEFSRQLEIAESYGLSMGYQTRTAFARKSYRQLHKLYPEANLYHWRDQYFVLVVNGSDLEYFQRVAQQIASNCRGWLRIKGLRIRTRCHVGWVHWLANQETINAEDLLSQAYLAINLAMTRQQRICQYHPEFRALSKARLTLEAKLRKAIDSEQLTLFFQPQFSLSDRRLIGAEVLVRWIDTNGHMISPGEFIPLAEQTGLIARLDHWVYERAMETLAGWVPYLPGDFRLSVNFSAVSVSKGLCERLAVALSRKWRVDPKFVCLEITESSIMSSPEQVKQSFARLRHYGFDIAIDDFGTGYSSMAYLKHLPVTHLKIDQSFTAGLEQGRTDQQIVKAIAAIGKSFGHQILIEGVEVSGQAKVAAHLGCQYVQGFHYAKPMQCSDFISKYLKIPANEVFYQLA
ncbi:MAG: hypothetical protein CENE_00335 [Candidatus Celerinatantimonas neptuna]|nr:MAG: hypothetical protein CENE_00335 [Candidatus Celerinatantimonas neptuna]